MSLGWLIVRIERRGALKHRRSIQPWHRDARLFMLLTSQSVSTAMVDPKRTKTFSDAV